MMFPRLSMVRRFPFDNGCPRPEVNTRAVLQLTHGISEHSGRYDRFARFLAKNGFRVYASDLRGHGLSVPQSELGKAGVQFWADTTADMKQLLDLMHKENPELPRFAFGHSLGSAPTQAHIQNWGSMFKGANLCGTFGAFPGMNATQLHDTAGALQPWHSPPRPRTTSLPFLSSY